MARKMYQDTRVTSGVIRKSKISKNVTLGKSPDALNGRITAWIKSNLKRGQVLPQLPPLMVGRSRFNKLSGMIRKNSGMMKQLKMEFNRPGVLWDYKLQSLESIIESDLTIHAEYMEIIRLNNLMLRQNDDLINYNFNTQCDCNDLVGCCVPIAALGVLLILLG